MDLGTWSAIQRVDYDRELHVLALVLRDGTVERLAIDAEHGTALRLPSLATEQQNYQLKLLDPARANGAIALALGAAKNGTGYELAVFHDAPPDEHGAIAPAETIRPTRLPVAIDATGATYALAQGADRAYMLDDPRVSVQLSEMNFGPLPMVTGMARLRNRFYDDPQTLGKLREQTGKAITAKQAFELGLVTFFPDELDWADEIRQAIEARTALSPDAVTGLEANLRFGGRETMDSRIFGRLSAWQNWIFSRPNAVGPAGALKVYGTGSRAKFDWGRV